MIDFTILDAGHGGENPFARPDFPDAAIVSRAEIPLFALLNFFEQRS